MLSVSSDHGCLFQGLERTLSSVLLVPQELLVDAAGAWGLVPTDLFDTIAVIFASLVMASVIL